MIIKNTFYNSLNICWLLGLAITIMVLFSTSPAIAANEKILPLGDSITQANEYHNSYRRALWFKLQDDGHVVDFVGSLSTNYSSQPPPNQDFDLDHEGHWGWRTDQLLNLLPVWLQRYTPEIVLLHAGTNDLIQLRPLQDIVDDIKLIIDTLRDDNPQVIILLAQLIPTATAANDSITDFNGLIPQIVTEKHTNLSPVILVDHNTGFDTALYTYDGVHPNELGEEKMAQKWFEAITNLLSEPIDITPPTIVGLEVNPEPTALIVEFSEDLDSFSANDTRNYSIDLGINVIDAQLQNDFSTVILTVSPLSTYTTYTLDVMGVLDLASPPNIANETMLFSISSDPLPATNPVPADSATSVATTSQLSWNDDGGATSYAVYFGSSNPPVYVGEQTTTSYDPGVLVEDTTYYWQIDAINGDGTTSGVVWSFQTVSSSGVLFFDDFERPDDATIGNNWIEKGAGLFSLSNGEVSKATGGNYKDNIVYRPASEALVDLETSIEFRLVSLPANYPQLHFRVSNQTVAQTSSLDSYLLWLYNNNTARISRNDGGNHITLATINLSESITTGEKYRFKAIAEEITPVMLQGFVERWSGTSWVVIGYGYYEDSSSQRKSMGTVGFSADNFNRAVYDNFIYESLNASGEPFPATNPLPVNGATSVATTSQLSWNDDSGATSYAVYFGSSNPPVYVGEQTTTSYDPGLLLEDTIYYWQIDTINGDGTTSGVVWSFQTDNIVYRPASEALVDQETSIRFTLKSFVKMARLILIKSGKESKTP